MHCLFFACSDNGVTAAGELSQRLPAVEIRGDHLHRSSEGMRDGTFYFSLPG